MPLLINTLSKYQAELKAILITHHHFDHIDLADSLSTKFNCRVIMSQQEITEYDVKLLNLSTFDGDAQLNICGFSIQAILTPGHTKGSTCFLIGDNLFTGDTLFNEGCGVCVGQGASPYEMFYSLQKLKKRILGQTKIYPGHQFGSYLGQTLQEITQLNIYLNIDNIDSFVKFRMRKLQPNMLSFI
ncbi:MAG: MBL fold metallo-hydrolase [Gammaproteobacteria bacterium]|nr:MBL fold metallo-hydrolase [Gammaproteobacteria bacterium]